MLKALRLLFPFHLVSTPFEADYNKITQNTMEGQNQQKDREVNVGSVVAQLNRG